MPKTMEKPTHFKPTIEGAWIEWSYGFLNTNNIRESIDDLEVLEERKIFAIQLSNGDIWDYENGWNTLPLTPPKKIDLSKFAKGVVTPVLPSYYLGQSLEEAKQVITGERQDSYGNPEDSFAVIAGYWSTYFTQRAREHGCTTCFSSISALDVAHMMMLFKLARCQSQAPKRDNYIDIQGYAAIAADRLVKEV